MMTDLLPEKMRQFFFSPTKTPLELSHSSGIADLIPGSQLDQFLFEPCGFSVNGIRDEVSML